MLYQAVIFDLDGTLIDSLEDLALAANRTLELMGFPIHPLHAYRTFVGDGLETLITRILPGKYREAAGIGEAVERFRELYSKNWHVKTAPYPGIAHMLTKLEEKGLPMAILSNKPDDFSRLCVAEILPEWHFHPVLGQRAGVAKKPDGGAAREIATLLKLAPARILFVGDSSVDMQTAANAGMDSAGVLWGFRTADELRTNGADYLISHPAELVEILLPQEKSCH